jgi:hypothetical protein
MPAPTPDQIRTVDPYASYNSDTVNKLNRMTTFGNDGLVTTVSCRLQVDSTAPLYAVTVGTGLICKDDVLVQVTSEVSVDLREEISYVNASFGTLSSTGYYYIVTDYAYQKARPAPQLRIKAIHASDAANKALVGTTFLLLGVVQVVSGAPNEISRFWDYDPTDTSKKRRYVNMDIRSETFLPTHNPDTDTGRVVYETSIDKFWFGFGDRWEEISRGVSVTVDTDSTGVEVGLLCYIDSNRKAQPAISTGSYDTRAEIIVLEVGTAASGNGRARMAGVVDTVQVETAIGINIGDPLYLSATEAGKVTSVRPSGAYQAVGRALSSGSGVSPVQVLFLPGDIVLSAVAGNIATVDWDSTAVNEYYYDVDISSLNIVLEAVLVALWDNSTNKNYSPTDFEIRDSGDTLRIWNTDNLDTNYIVSDGAGGGSAGSGTGGVTDHGLLTGLSYAASGHTGFAPSPHGNADHSSTFITASGVTFENLDANGDVGTGASQVAEGDHTHSIYTDIPTDEVILFERDDAVIGYTLLIDYDDVMVYISKGSDAGGQPSGPTESSFGDWTSTSHTHTTSDFTLQETHIPAHNHGGGNHGHTATVYWGGASGAGFSGRAPTSGFSATTTYQTDGSGTIITTEGGGNPHNHGPTDPGSIPTSWRPESRVFTRQKRL